MDEKICLIAHRGIHNNKDVPENSILAFKKAISYNYPIELDVQLTKDNVLIVFHDNNLKRMTKYDKNVNELTYNEIKKLKLLNTNETIPTLRDVLNLINGKVNIYIEIKDTNDVQKICNIVNNELKNYNHFLIIQSFNNKIVKWFSKHNPFVYNGLLINKKNYNSFWGKMIVKRCKPKFLSISKKYISEYKLQDYYKDYTIVIWTILDKNEINDFKKITNTFICNNLPFKK